MFFFDKKALLGKLGNESPQGSVASRPLPL